MASRKEHNKDCLEKLGNEWDCVNRWLDGLAPQINFEGVECLDCNHRIHRHNKEGVEEVRKMWGDEAAKAAEIHIKRDMNQIWTKKRMFKVYGEFQLLEPWENMFND